MKKTILNFTLALALLVGTFGLSSSASAIVDTTSAVRINDFYSCSKVYGVQESAPPRCTDLKTGRVYIQNQASIQSKPDIKRSLSAKIIYGPKIDSVSSDTLNKYKKHCSSVGGKFNENGDSCQEGTQCFAPTPSYTCENIPKDSTEILKSDLTLSKINSFADCEAAGLPIMESQPRQCKTPDGRLFIEKVPTYSDRSKSDADAMRLKAEMQAKLKADDKQVRTVVSADVKADINQDGKVGFADLRKMMSVWGKCQDKMCSADLNSDGQVDHADIQILFKFWTEANEKGMIEKCLTVKEEGTKRSCFWNLTVGNQEEVKEKREKIKASFEKMKPELKGNVEVEKKIENYLFHMENILTRISGAIAKLQGVVEKVEARIKLMEEEGLDTGDIKASIEEVKAKIKVVTSESATLSSDSNNVAVENKTEFFAKVRMVADNIKEAHKMLGEAISNLKALKF